jgi:hypothetical protein
VCTSPAHFGTGRSDRETNHRPRRGSDSDHSDNDPSDGSDDSTDRRACRRPRDRMPPRPAFPFMNVPRENVYVMKYLLNCNYAQTLENEFDTSHSAFLDSTLTGDNMTVTVWSRMWDKERGGDTTPSAAPRGARREWPSTPSINSARSSTPRLAPRWCDASRVLTATGTRTS